MARKAVTVEDSSNEAAQPVEATVMPELAQTETPAVTPPKRQSGFFGGALFGLLAAGAGFGAAQYWPLNTANGISDTAAQTQTEIAAIKEQLAQPVAADPAMIARLDALESSLKSVTESADLTAITARIAALETRPQSNANDVTALQQQVAALKSQMNPVDAAALVKTAIAAELDGVSSAAAEMRDQALQAAKSAETGAAIGLLRAALDTGAPYASLVDLPNFPALLAEHAAAGIPSLGTLKATFPDAARAALEAALKANMGQTWSERVTNFLRNQTGARALYPREGNDPDAVLSRIDAALNIADLQTVLTEIQALPPEAQTAMLGWTEQTQLRQSAIGAVAAFAKTGE
jgi:hypothetical protein